jgi:hypothetical protein
MIQRVFLGLCLLAFACFGGDLNGKWTAKVQSPNGELDVTYVFKVEEGKITGTASSHMGEFKITEGTLANDDVTFILNVNMNGEEMKLAHKGKLAGDELKLTLDVNGQTMEINAKRS